MGLREWGSGRLCLTGEGRVPVANATPPPPRTGCARPGAPTPASELPSGLAVQGPGGGLCRPRLPLRASWPLPLAAPTLSPVGTSLLRQARTPTTFPRTEPRPGASRGRSARGSPTYPHLHSGPKLNRHRPVGRLRFPTAEHAAARWSHLGFDKCGLSAAQTKAPLTREGSTSDHVLIMRLAPE